MKSVQYTFLLFIFLKQFYIFKSGTLQPGDIFLLVSFFLLIFKRRRKLYLNKKDMSLFIFVCCVVLINFIYYYFYLDKSFLISIMHYIFNLIVVIVFRQLLQHPLFPDRILLMFKFNLVLQILIFICGFGNYYGGVRYMGTFNDPNQFAFYIYITLMLLIIMSMLQNRHINMFYYTISLLMILLSGSTGMLVAFILFVITYIVVSFYKKNRMPLVFTRRYILKILAILVSITICLITIVVYNEDLMNTIHELPIFSRLEEKVSKVNIQEDGLIEERGLDKLLLYPEKMIFGAGQGAYWRFDRAAHQLEIHSTFPSILFYYGIIPMGILLVWLGKQLGRIPIMISPILISLLIESFTLLNQRQPFFWMLFVAISVLREKTCGIKSNS